MRQACARSRGRCRSRARRGSGGPTRGRRPSSGIWVRPEIYSGFVGQLEPLIIWAKQFRPLARADRCPPRTRLRHHRDRGEAFAQKGVSIGHVGQVDSRVQRPLGLRNGDRDQRPREDDEYLSVGQTKRSDISAELLRDVVLVSTILRRCRQQLLSVRPVVAPLYASLDRTFEERTAVVGPLKRMRASRIHDLLLYVAQASTTIRVAR